MILLALLCVGSAELVACRHFAPETYTRITAPVKAAAHGAAEMGQAAISTVAARAAELAEEAAARAAERAAQKALEASEPTASGSSAHANAITELILDPESGAATLTGGVMPVAYYNQTDPRWGDAPYGSDDIGRYGCGPTAMAMAVQSFTGETITPAQMAQVAVKGGYWARAQGSYLSIVNGLAKNYGLVSAPLEKTPEAIETALLSGNLVVALMGPGHFTTGGHFILIRGITLDGQLLVADPNSTENSLQTWDPQLILSELSHSSAHGAPLWSLSAGS